MGIRSPSRLVSHHRLEPHRLDRALFRKVPLDVLVGANMIRKRVEETLYWVAWYIIAVETNDGRPPPGGGKLGGKRPINHHIDSVEEPVFGNCG